MQVTPTNFTIAQYCDQMIQRTITVNPDYQRSEKVWPPAARSYLIDTILSAFPMPKLYLYQRTDLSARKTIFEIVDGQQRSKTILDFYQNKLRVTGNSRYSGRIFSQLEDGEQYRFLDYSLSADLFVGATPTEIRQVFRRINSYNVPLNHQETRHAVYQGAFKWFIIELSNKYTQLLKDIGSLSERQLSRMADVELLTQVIMAMTSGIETQSQRKIDRFYADNEQSFPRSADISSRIDAAFSFIIDWREIHNTFITKPFNIYSLILGIMHMCNPINSLQQLYQTSGTSAFQRDIVVANLTALAAAIDERNHRSEFRSFLEATSEATNTEKQRATRFRIFCRALEPTLL